MIRSSQRGSHQFFDPEQLHRGGHEQHADEGGVEQHRQGEPGTEQLDDAVVLEQERAEHDDHDRGGGRDHPGRGGEAVGDRVLASRRCGRTPP